MIRFTCALLTLMLAAAQATETESFTVTLEVDGLVANTGTVHVSLFGSRADYMREPLLTRELAVGAENRVSLVFSHVPPGEYAITLYYDENGNGKLDTRIFGIPKEKVGFSNNAWSKFGPARWKDARFMITDTDVLLKVRARRIGEKKNKEKS